MSALPPLYGNLSNWALVQAESIQFMKLLPDNSVDAICTDPPYWLAFNGNAWDGASGSDYPSTAEGFQCFTRDWSREALRILKPGGHMLAFGAARTGHRLAVGIEDAGFELRDTLAWMYASGMPKSRRLPNDQGTALKPAYEPLILARKPLTPRLDGKPGTVVDSIARFGTGALNIGESRIARRPTDPGDEDYWPPNVMLSHDDACADDGCSSACPISIIDAQGDNPDRPVSRIFHSSKASQIEREAGLDQLEAKVTPIFSAAKYRARPRKNLHPTVKPLGVMAWAIGLVTPEGGLVADPFTGSGSTGCAAMLAGRRFIGIERESDYVEIALARLRHWSKEAVHDAS